MQVTQGGESDCDKAADEVSETRTEKRCIALEKRKLLVTPGERSTRGALGAHLVMGGSEGQRRELGDSTELCSREDRN